MKFRINTWKDLLIHICIIVVLGVSSVFIFFFVYLPAVTNHGETITVPDVRGVSIEDLDQFLEVRNLRYEVTEDSGFSADLPPLTVLKQLPMPNSKVKENRKIYVTLNAEKPPVVRMPKLVGGSVKNAQLVLKTYDLKLGEITYVPDLALNYVLEQNLNGRAIPEGEKIPKGSTIDLTVGDGLGKVTLESPDLTGLDLESARFAIVGSGLKTGRIVHEKTPPSPVVKVVDQDTVVMQIAPGSVYRQEPAPGKIMRLEQMVDLWVYSPDSVNVNPTLLDQ